jgi:hypothetical protein
MSFERDPDTRFLTCFFHQTTSPGSLIHRLKPFGMWLQICEDNWGSWLYSGVNDTAVQPFCQIFLWMIWHCFFLSMTLLCKYDTAITLDLIFMRFWQPLKGISIEKTYIGKMSCTIPITFTHKIWGLTRDNCLSQRCNCNAVTKSGDFTIFFANSKPYSKRL